MPDPTTPPPSPAADAFATTRWSLVLAAGGGGSEASARALEQLCRTYWYPVYASIRRRNHGTEEARDLTQGFFATLLARNSLGQVTAPRGRFRWFLLAALKHFLADERDRARAQKRGGGVVPLSLDATAADAQYALEPRDEASPDRLFERRWALTVLEGALARLREEQTLAGRNALLDDLLPFVTAEGGEDTYAGIAARHETTEAAIKMTVQRLRRRLRELLHAMVAETLERPEDAADELRALVAALRG